MPEKFVPRKIDISPQPVIVDPGTTHERVRHPDNDAPNGDGDVVMKFPVKMEESPHPDSTGPQDKPAPPIPTCPVTFDLGAAGQVQMNYHRVVETQEAVVLVYDNRFSAYGARFRPPVNSVPITVEVRNRDIQVVSLGIEIPLAAEDLHLTVLLKANREAEEAEEAPSSWEDDEDAMGLPAAFQSPLGDEL